MVAPHPVMPGPVYCRPPTINPPSAAVRYPATQAVRPAYPAPSSANPMFYSAAADDADDDDFDLSSVMSSVSSALLFIFAVFQLF